MQPVRGLVTWLQTHWPTIGARATSLTDSHQAETRREVAWASFPAGSVPLSATERDGATVVIGRVSGEFPGSPVELQHVFRIDGEQIVSLEIR